MQRKYRKSVDGLPTALASTLEPSDDQMSNRYLSIVSDQILLDSKITDQIGFTILPNREVCIAGLKLAGQFMPQYPKHKLRFLMSLGKWLSKEMKDCFAESGIWFTISRYNYIVIAVF